MKTFKHSICILLSLLMLLSVCSAAPFAVQAAQTSDAVGAFYNGKTGGCNWLLNTSTGVMSITAREGENGKMADYISDNQPWYEYGDQITAVKIENGVKYIGDYSFFNMKNIISLTIGDTVETIGYSAFAGCDITSFTIPASVTEINDRAFVNNKNMTSATIPPTVTYIGAKAFGYNADQKIEYFDIYGYKGSKAEKYANNNGFQFFEIGAYNGTTGDCTWKFDPSTETLTVSGSGAMADYKWDNDTLSTDAPWWDYHDQITSVIIGDSVTDIGCSAFMDCSNITSVTLGKRVKTIREFAFARCDLRTLDLPLSLHTIEKSAFANNAALVSVDLKGNLEAIGRYAFADCPIYNLTLPESLKSVGFSAFINNAFKTVVIPKSVTYIEEYAFGFESAMKIIENFTIYGWPDTEAEYYAGINGFTFVPIGGETGDCTWSFDPSTGTLTVSGSGEMANYDWISSTESINVPWWDFRNQIKSVVIGDGVTVVGNSAFEKCNNLTSLTLGKSVKEITYCAFYFCNLSELVLPDSVEEIGNSAFCENRNLKTVSFGKSLKTIGSAAFLFCDLSELVLPDGVISIDNNAFTDNNNLKKATIPASVIAIYEKAFGYKDDSTKVEGFTICGFPDTAAQTYAEENGFNFVPMSGITGDCTWEFDPGTGIMTISGSGKMDDYINPFDDESEGKIAPWWDIKDQITAVVIGDGVTYVGDYAFMLANTESLTLGKNVNSIGNRAFYANKLTEVVIPDSVEVIGDYAFSNNDDLADVTFGRDLQTIGDSAFCACNLRSVVFPDSVIKIGGFAFSENNDLSSVEFGENLDFIGEYAFLNCDLTEVEIPQSVSFIGYGSFGFLYHESELYTTADFTVKGYSGTAAEEYADDNGFTFIPIGGTIVYGDVNGDGSVTIDDATLVQKAVAELAELDAKQQKAADVNGDGDVTIDDATLIQKYVAEIIDRFPVHALLG